MKQPIAACVGLIAFALVGAGDANAQVTYFGLGYYGGYYGPRYYDRGLPPSQVMRIVRHAGFAPLSAPVRRGPNYVVTAAGRGGGQVWVVVNAYEGAIVSVRPAAAQRPYRGLVPYDPRIATAPPAGREPPSNAGPGPGIDRGAQTPLPPTPSQRFANVPATGSVPTGPIPPARTPVPRPRPNVASNDSPATTGTTPAPAPPAAAPKADDVPEAPPAPLRARPTTPMVPVAPLD